MGTTFVSLKTHKASLNEPGFWMKDGMLELWLRLLALHLPEPTNTGAQLATIEIRNKWLLASRGYFGGHVPHSMEYVSETQERREVVRIAIHSLLAALSKSNTPLHADTLNLLGNEAGQFTAPIERKWLEDIGHAFLDLLDGNISGVVSSTEIMPGSTPYKRNITTS